MCRPKRQQACGADHHACDDHAQHHLDQRSRSPQQTRQHDRDQDSPRGLDRRRRHERGARPDVEGRKREQPSAQPDRRGPAPALARPCARASPGAVLRSRSRQEQQVEAEHDEEHHQEVVVVAAESPHQHDRVQADEHDRRQRVASQQPRAPPDQEDRRQAGHREDALQRPEGGGHAERDDGERQQREQRSVGAQQLVPVAQEEARIVVRLEDRDRRVRVEVVHDLHAPVVDVVEDVRQRQRRREQEDRVNGHDRCDHPAGGQPRRVLERDAGSRRT